MSAAVSLPAPTELKARLVTWLLLLLVVLVAALLVWMGLLLSFGVANLVSVGVLGRGFGPTWQALYIAATAAACALAGAFAYFCLVRGTLREGQGGESQPRALDLAESRPAERRFTSGA